MAWRFCLALTLLKLISAETFSCSNLKPVANANLTELLGVWVKLDTVLFSYGRPWLPSEYGQDPQSKETCHRIVIDNLTDDTLSGAQNFYYSGGELATHLSGPFTLNVSDAETSRWSIVPSEHTHPVVKDVELLLLYVDKISRIAVVALCLPGDSLDTMLENSPMSSVLNPEDKPESSELLLTSLSIFAPVELGPPTPEAIKVVRRKTKKLVGLKKYEGYSLGTFCVEEKHVEETLVAINDVL